MESDPIDLQPFKMLNHALPCVLIGQATKSCGHIIDYVFELRCCRNNAGDRGVRGDEF